VQPTGRPNARMRQTVGDMVRSMAVVLGVVLVIVVLAWRPDPEAVKVVDPAPFVTVAARTAEFPVREPTGLPEGWRPTSARWEPTEKSESAPVLHIGYVTPADAYAQLSQSTAQGDAYLGEQADNGQPAGTQDVAGVEWRRLESADRRSLVRADGAALIVVSGTAEWDELAQLAASLETVAVAE
jgi:hypothetical protein